MGAVARRSAPCFRPLLFGFLVGSGRCCLVYLSVQKATKVFRSLAPGRQLVFLCFLIMGSEGEVRHWGPLPAGPLRPSGPCCLGVAEAPFLTLGGWKTASRPLLFGFLVGSGRCCLVCLSVQKATKVFGGLAPRRQLVTQAWLPNKGLVFKVHFLWFMFCMVHFWGVLFSREKKKSQKHAFNLCWSTNTN